MLASVCIKYVHNYSFPSILNSARASYSRRHRLTDANTRVLSVLAIGLTVSRLYFHTCRQSLPCPAEEAFSYRRKARSAPQDTPYRTPEKPFLRRGRARSVPQTPLSRSAAPCVRMRKSPFRIGQPCRRSGPDFSFTIFRCQNILPQERIFMHFRASPPPRSSHACAPPGSPARPTDARLTLPHRNYSPQQDVY